jgi:hypothetical protein
MGTTNGFHHANGTTSAPLRVAIVGGGIGGLALALGMCCDIVEQVLPTLKLTSLL